MPAGPWQVFRRAKTKLANGTFDLDTQTFKMALTQAAQVLTDDFAGSSTDCRYADLTAEVPNGSGYATGGKTLSCTWNRSAGTVTFDCDDQAWTSSTFTAKYAVIYADNTNDDLLCFCELDTVTSVSPSAGTLTVTINASGVFTLA